MRALLRKSGPRRVHRDQSFPRVHQERESKPESTSEQVRVQGRGCLGKREKAGPAPSRPLIYLQKGSGFIV